MMFNSCSHVFASTFTSGVYYTHPHISLLGCLSNLLYHDLVITNKANCFTVTLLLLTCFQRGHKLNHGTVSGVCVWAHKWKMATILQCLSKALLSMSQLDFKEHPISCRLLIQNVISGSNSHGISTTSLPHCSWQAERALRLKQLVEKKKRHGQFFLSLCDTFLKSRLSQAEAHKDILQGLP